MIFQINSKFFYYIKLPLLISDYIYLIFLQIFAEELIKFIV